MNCLHLGACTEQEAWDLAHRLSDRLRWSDVSVRIGIGPSIPVAELVAQTCPPPQRIALVPANETPAFLKRLPIAALCALSVPMPISEDMVFQLRRYGVRTLGHLARFDEVTLRRQFGAMGGQVARLARGEAPVAFQPTPPTPALRFRARFSSPVSVEQVVHRLPRFAAHIARQLQTQRQAVGTLTLTVWWESGGVEFAHVTLRETAHERAPLAPAFEPTADVAPTLE